MIEPTTYAGKRLINKLKYEVDYDRLETYSEMIRMIEEEAGARERTEIRDGEAETRFLSRINPDPVTDMARQLKEGEKRVAD